MFGAIAIVFAVGGANTGLFSGVASINAYGAGWLITAIVDILWVLYFTADDDSLMLHVFNSLGTGGLSPPGRRRRTRAASVHNMTSANGGYASNYASGQGIGPDTPYDPKGVRTQSFVASDAGAPRSIGATGSVHNVQAGNISADGPSSPLMGGAAGVGAGGMGNGSLHSTADTSVPAPETYMYKAKALYACALPIITWHN